MSFSLDPAQIHDAESAAKSLEAYFYKQVLSTAWKSDSLGDGFAGGVFQDLFHEALAHAMADASETGFTQSLMPELTGDTHQNEKTDMVPVRHDFVRESYEKNNNDLNKLNHAEPSETELQIYP